jgi:hypothetical protein
MVLNCLKSTIDHYENMIGPSIKKLNEYIKVTNDINKQSSALSAIRSVQNFRDICSYIGYILYTKEFIDPPKYNEYYNYLSSILPHFCQDLRIEHEDLNRKSQLLKDEALINIVKKAQFTMAATLSKMKNKVRILQRTDQ